MHFIGPEIPSVSTNQERSSRRESVNYDTQTTGGTKGFSLKPAAVTKYYFSAEFRNTTIWAICAMMHHTKFSSQHSDLQLFRVIKGNQDMAVIMRQATGLDA